MNQFVLNCLGVMTSVVIFFSVAMGYDLPDTGIETCYDQSGNEISCTSSTDDPLNRQDAHFTGLSFSYQVNGDGTVSDLVTDRMWQKEHDGTNRNWEDACEYCETLELAGYSDWKAPDRRELFSLVHFGKYYPAISEDIFSEMENSNYWTATIDAGDDQNAWFVNLIDGYMGALSKRYSAKVLCVRVDQTSNSDGRLVDNGDGTITDTATGLIWQQMTAEDAIPMTWEEALAYGENLSLSGDTDWRLPNIRELESLVDATLSAPAINESYFVDIENEGYWSSSTYAPGTQAAWAVHFRTGAVYSRNKSEKNNVLCVREGSSEPLTLSISAGAVSGFAPLDVSFTAEVLGGMSPYTANLSWNFGDGSSEQTQGLTIDHTYEEDGTFNVTCTVYDEGGQSATASLADSIVVDPAEINLEIHQLDLITIDGEPAIQGVASVADGNYSFLTGLSTEDFTLYEDGVEITNFTVTEMEDFASLSLVLDYSGSMGSGAGSLLEDLEAAATTFVKFLSDEDEAQIVKFDSTVETVQPYTTDKSLLTDAINNQPYGGGGTALYDGIYQGITETIGREGRRVVIAMTDGSSNSDVHTEDEVILYAQENDIPVITIGLGSGIDSAILERIAEETGGYYYNAPDASDLEAVYREVAATVLHPYTIEYVPANPDTRQHEVTLELEYFDAVDSDSKSYMIPCTSQFECPEVYIYNIDSCLGGVTVDLTLASLSNSNISAISVDLTYDDSVITEPLSSIGPAGQDADKNVLGFEMEANTYRISISSTNDNSISSEGVIATIMFDVESKVYAGDETTLELSANATDPQGYQYSVRSKSAKIDFVNCRIGDCDGDGFVSCLELEEAVKQFFGESDTAGCNDQFGDGIIDIGDIQTIINNYIEDNDSELYDDCWDPILSTYT